MPYNEDRDDRCDDERAEEMCEIRRHNQRSRDIRDGVPPWARDEESDEGAK